MIPLSDVLDVMTFLMEQGLNENVSPFIQEHTAYIITCCFIWIANGNLLRDEKESEEIADRVKKMMDILGQFVSERPNIENPPALKPLRNKPNIDFLTDVWSEFVKMYGECKANHDGNGSDGDNTNDEKVEEKKDSQSGDGVDDVEMKKESNTATSSKPMSFEIRSIQSPFRTFHRLKKRYSHSIKLKIEEYEVQSWEGVQMKGLLPIWLEFGIPKLRSPLSSKGDGGNNKMEQYVVVDYIHGMYPH